MNDDVLLTPLGLAVLAELDRRGYSLEHPAPDDVFDAIVAELRARPFAEATLAHAVRRFGGS
jgi:hypothetical protein